MTSKAAVDSVLNEKNLAVIGVSRNHQKFGNMVVKELSGKGFSLFPVHPELDQVYGVKCYPSLTDLPEPAGAAFVAVAPQKSAAAVRQAHEAGITKIWIQQMAQSDEAIQYCREHDITFVSGECILMHAEPVGSIHKFHRFFKKLFGRMPR